MTAPTITRSAYPTSVDDLVPMVRELAELTGQMPSRNRLMKEFRVGAPKATAVLEALNQDTPAVALAPMSTMSPAPADPATGAAPSSGPDPVPVPEPAGIAAAPVDDAAESAPLDSPAGHPDTTAPAEATPKEPKRPRTVRSWPVLLLALPAFVAIWSGWVGLGGLTGFGIVHPLPGIWDSARLNTAITLPIGMETYAAFALHVWLSGAVSGTARTFAKWSAFGALLLGGGGQVAYHLMASAGITTAPWPITALVACLPVLVLGCGAALVHLVRAHR